jgi:hypothetical protein
MEVSEIELAASQHGLKIASGAYIAPWPPEAASQARTVDPDPRIGQARIDGGFGGPGDLDFPAVIGKTHGKLEDVLRYSAIGRLEGDQGTMHLGPADGSHKRAATACMCGSGRDRGKSRSVSVGSMPHGVLRSPQLPRLCSAYRIRWGGTG